MAVDIRQWLEELGLGRYADTFVDNGVDFDIITELDDSDLEKLKVNLGDRKRLQRIIAQLDVNGPNDIGDDISNEPDLHSSPAERRQLTVMFCDLVGSTTLSQQLDPEDLRNVMRQYQDAAAGAVTRYGGHVAKYLGDGVLAYFGWPIAYEDQAERAVQAGLEATATVTDIRLDSGEKLFARVGIASGQVVIGDLIGDASSDRESVSGETPNLAARLQNIAEPGQVLVGATTRRLIGTTFELQDLGPQILKGFKDKIPAWQVIGKSSAESRFEAAHIGALTGLAGRDNELGLLRERWDFAVNGEGQLVLLSGEAGIGKSRLVQAVREHLINQPHFQLRYQCSPYHTNSSFYPIIQRLEHAAKFAADDSVDEKLDKLESLLAMSEEDVDPAAPLFASLLSLPNEARYGIPIMTPQQRRSQTINALVDQVMALARQRPVLFVLEDAHWIDPTSEELIGELVTAVSEAAVFLLITHRPEYMPPWSAQAHTTAIMLNRLSRAQSAEIVAATGSNSLDSKIIEHIVDRADGVPLFLEELTSFSLENEARGDRTEIPATLHALLMARLDHLEDAKEVAQVGAVIGREFSYALLSELIDLEAEKLQAALDRLVHSGLVFRRGALELEMFIFKHALVRDEAYSSLLLSERRRLHHQVADTIIRIFPEMDLQQPDTLARHLTDAGEIERAIPFWQRAADRAATASACAEAEQLSKIGLDMLQELPRSVERNAQKLQLLLTLGSVLMPMRGFASPEVGEVYAQAHEVSQHVDDTGKKFAATWGYWMYSYQSGVQIQAENLAAEVLTISEEDKDTGRRLQAHHAAWTLLSMTGDLNQCQSHIQQGKLLYDVDMHFDHAHHFGGHDPGVCCWNHAGMIDWVLGYPDDARQDALTACALADQLSHPFSQMLSRVFAGWTYQCLLDPAGTEAMAAEAIAIGAEHGFHQYLGVMAIFQAWARTSTIPEADCVAALQDGLDSFHATGSSARLAYFLSVVADGCRKLGKIDEGLSVVEEGLQCVEQHGQTRWAPELHRLKGRLLLMQSRPNVEAVETTYRKALTMTKEQMAKSLELRVATDLARLLQDQGRENESRDLLQPIYDWFTQGFNTPDLIEAKAQLDELA